jgi:predicted nucleic acid-binding protein
MIPPLKASKKVDITTLWYYLELMLLQILIQNKEFSNEKMQKACSVQGV